MNPFALASKLGRKVARGSWRGAGLRAARALSLPLPPTFLVYAVTRRCNSRCVMCKIWQTEPEAPELGIEEIERALADPFFAELRYVNVTGGEPSLRKDLPELCRVLGALPQMKALQIPTNGLLSRVIVDQVRAILERTPPSVDISVSVSIDGDPATHDRIRGIRDMHRHIEATLGGLSEIADPRLTVGIECTVSAANVDQIEAALPYLCGLASHVGIYPAVQAAAFYRNAGEPSVRSNAEVVGKMLRFFERQHERDPAHAFLYDQIIHFLRTGRRRLTCLGGLRTVYLSPEGETFPCFLLEDRREACFGDVRDGSAGPGWRGDRGRAIRASLGPGHPTCGSCSLYCDLINNLNEEFFEIVGHFLARPREAMRLLGSLRAGRVKLKNVT
jgi:MoaA/NifB/PqqE/SkfB family radical SAM enzyme